ncbi:MAG TPA: tetratricopeptide repeat protein [Ktedonobacteraceae bacterium]|nr:tetratricopeptide repeat protein [Ktedonobacteraceae bacterium]
MTQALSAEEKARLKKQWTELAVKQAQEGQWEEAVTTNKNILNIFPQESDALNRLGKAYTELGQYANARQAYSQTLKHNPLNSIAKKNLERLDSLQTVPVSATPASLDRIDPRAFIEETGKTGVTELINLAPTAVLARVSYGDRVNLQVNGHRLLVQNAAGEGIGQVEPRLANRLISYIEGGNRYGAAILAVAVEQNRIRMIIREEYQHPSMFGKVSFLSRGGGETLRAYTKDSMLRYDREDEDELGSDDEYYDGGDDADEMTEIDFEGGSESEE